MIKKVLVVFLVLLMVLSFQNCDKGTYRPYPKSLSEAIQYFYIENKNAEVIHCLDKLTTKDLSNPEIAELTSIFRAAAL